MADNVTLDPGSGGAVIAGDDISSVVYQRIKLVHGADGVNDGDISTANPFPVRLYLGTTIVTAGAGAVAAGTPRVTLASDDPAVAALQLLDNAVSGAGFNITQFNGVNVSMGNGASGTGVLRVTLANDSTGVVAATQSGTWTVTGAGGSFPVTDSGGSLTVDAPVGTPVFVRLSDGSAAITTLAVSLASVPSHAVTNAGTFVVQVDGAALTSLQLLDDVIYADDADWADDTSKHLLVGGLYQSVPQTVTDGDVAPFNITVNGALHVAVQNTLTVATHAVTQSGTWTVTGAGGTFPVTDSGGSLTVDAPVGTPVFVRLSDGSAAITTLAVSLASVPSHAVTNAGTFAVQVDGAALTSLQLLDDAVSGAGFNITQLNGVNVSMGNGASGTGVLRVTLANDSTGIVSLTTSTASIGKLAANSGVDIGDVDVMSIIPGVGATNLGKAVDTATGATDTGVLALATRDDALSALTPIEGDNIQLRVDANGALWCIVSGTVTVASHAVTNAGTFVVQENGAALTALQLIDNAVSGAGFNITQFNGVNVTMGNGASGTGVLRVTLANDSTGIVSLTTSTASIGKLAANSGVDIGDVDVTTVPADPFGVNADAGSATGSISAKLRFIAATGIPITGTVTVAAHAVTNAGTFLVQENGPALTALQLIDDWDNAASDGASVSGDVAHDTADVGEPVKIGSKALASPKGVTLVADADRTNQYADLDGIPMVKLGTSGADHVSEAVSNTDGASTAFTNFGATASTFNAVTSITAFRTDAGTSMAYIDFRDGTGGAVLFRIPLPPLGGCTLSLAGQPLFKTSANTALAFDVSSALTTVYLSVTGFKTKC